MEPGRYANKNFTSAQGQGISPTGAAPKKTIFLDRETTSSGSANPHWKDDVDSQNVLTGPGGGAYASHPGNNPHRWGHTAPSGARFEINDSNGSERIEIIHPSGAGVVFEPDGGVYVASKSQRGMGLSANFGDFYISAAGTCVIKSGGAVVVESAGDLNLVCGGTLNISAGAIKITTKVLDETIDGSATRSVTNDQSVVVGGINRKTVAGDDREQISSDKIVDVQGNFTTRIDGDNTNDVTGKSVHTIKGDHTLSSQAKTAILSADNTSIDTGDDLVIKTGGFTNMSTADEFGVVSGGNMTIATQADLGIGATGNANFAAGGTAKLFGATAKVSGATTNIESTGTTTVRGGGDTNIHGGTIRNYCNTFLSKTPSGDPGGPTGGTTDTLGGVPAPEGPDAPEDAKESDVAEVNDIVDSLTSQRKHPEYPGNGVHETATQTGASTISHDTTPGAEGVYNEYSGQNEGNLKPSYQGGSYDTLPETPVNRGANISASDPGIPVPDRHNGHVKVSKYFTLGMMTGAPNTHTIPATMWESVVKNHILVASNVLDQIKEKFPNVYISSAFRMSRPNHITGRAIDLQVPGKSLTTHAEIARFARDNLPVDQVFLERNEKGNTWVHVRVSETGATGNPTVLTCADKRCDVKTPGIDVGWLERSV